ncbi:cytochrome P450 [Backusella circina FSU 941]|nr:cytochrome P450 [Backusella circina FSU 941]
MEVNTIVHHIDNIKDQILEYLSKRSNLQQIAKITSVSAATYYVIHKLYIGFFGPLANAPGPFSSRFISFPKLTANTANGKLFTVLKELHTEYGHVVRLSPQAVSVSDKALIKQILVTDDLKKEPFYDSVSSRRDRRIMSPAFSIKYINSLEPFMTSVTESLLEKIDKEIENNSETVDIWNLYQCLALDIIGETAFGQSFRMIENNSHYITKAIGKELREFAIVHTFPILSKLFLKNASRFDPKLEKFVQDIIEKRMASSQKRTDILQYLIDSQMAEDKQDRLTTKEIVAEMVLILIAGSETTSNTLGFAIYELVSHPDKLEKLYNEIDQLTPHGKLFEHEELKQAPYLNAVIYETLRLDTVAAGLGRITTEKTVLGNQYVLPKNTIIFANIHDIQTCEDYWDRPNEFIPERWLPEQTEVRPADAEAFIPFSSGSRNCIGKNFALQEMRHALSALLKHYDISATKQELEDAKERSSYLTMQITKNSLKIHFKHRKAETS